MRELVEAEVNMEELLEVLKRILAKQKEDESITTLLGIREIELEKQMNLMLLRQIQNLYWNDADDFNCGE